jgi:hypothetical protein
VDVWRPEGGTWATLKAVSGACWPWPDMDSKTPLTTSSGGYRVGAVPEPGKSEETALLHGRQDTDKFSRAEDLCMYFHGFGAYFAATNVYLAAFSMYFHAVYGRQ